MASALSASSGFSTPKTSESVWSSHSFEGVPRKRWMCSAKVRQMRRPSDSAGEPSRGETPSASRGTPWL